MRINQIIKLTIKYLLIIVIVLYTSLVFSDPGTRVFIGGASEEEAKPALSSNAGLAEKSDEKLDPKSNKNLKEEQQLEDSDKKPFGNMTVQKLSEKKLYTGGDNSVSDQEIESNDLTNNTSNREGQYVQPGYEHEMEKMKENRLERGRINPNIPLALENRMLKIRQQVEYTQKGE